MKAMLVGLSYNIITDAASFKEKGITDEWELKWSSAAGVTFTPATSTAGDAVKVTFDNYNTDYTVTLKATPPDEAMTGVSDKDVTQQTIYGTPTISGDPIGSGGTDYSFTADLTDTGITESEATFAWTFDKNLDSKKVKVVDGNKNIDYDFGTAGDHTAELTVTPKSGATPLTTEELSFSGLTPDEPTIAFSEPGSNPLVLELEADLTDTGIDNTWTRTWTVNGKDIEDEATNKITTDPFPLTSTDYTVTYTAVSNDGRITRSVDKTVTTGDAKTPNFSLDANDVLKYTIDTATQEFQDSGITNEWDLEWSVTPDDNTTFSTNPSKVGDAVTVNFDNYNKDYTVTLNATPPEGSSITPPNSKDATAKTGFGTPTISGDPIGDSGTDYSLEADLTGTEIAEGNAKFTWVFDEGTADEETKVVTANKSVDYDFGTEGDHTATLTVLPETGADTVETSTLNLSVGVPDKPDLTTSQVGSNPLVYEFEADLTNTGIDNDWSRTWTIAWDGQSRDIDDTNANKIVTSEPNTLPYTSTEYTITYTAVRDDGLTRTQSTTVTTANATTPSLTLTIDPDDTSGLRYIIDTSNFKNNGITDDWTLNWSSSPSSATFETVGDKVKVVFAELDTSYTVTLGMDRPTGTSIPEPSDVSAYKTTPYEPQYPTTAVYHIPDDGGSVSATSVAALWGPTRQARAGLKSVTGNNSNGTITFKCKKYNYIKKKAVDLANGSRYAFNQGPNGEKAEQLIFVYWNRDDNEMKSTVGYDPAIAYHNTDGTVGSNTVHITGVACWSLST